MEREVLLEEFVHDMMVHGGYETLLDQNGVYILRNPKHDLILFHDGTWIKKILSRTVDNYEFW